MWLVYCLNYYLFLSPISILCFYIFTFPTHLTLELAFGDSGEAWGPKIKAFYFKEWGLRGLGMISIQNSLYLPWKD